MQEPILSPGRGTEFTRPAWPVSPERADSAHSDVARTEATPSPQPVALPGSGTHEADPGTPVHDAAPDAAFARSYARFSINSETQRISIKIVDAATDEVIREIPSEEVQRIAEDLQGLARRGAGRRATSSTDIAAGGGVDRYV